jgi:hypothetical protein
VGEPLRTLQTNDGRTLAFAVWGDPSGFPIMALHGTPGCRLQRYSDRAQLARPEVMQILREAAAEWAFNGVGGWVDDDLAFTRPWGFDVSNIAVPVLIIYGSADVLVPSAHGRWLAAHVPGCIVKSEVGGHLGVDPETEITENARWLQEGLVPVGALSPDH